MDSAGFVITVIVGLMIALVVYGRWRSGQLDARARLGVAFTSHLPPAAVEAAFREAFGPRRMPRVRDLRAVTLHLERIDPARDGVHRLRYGTRLGDVGTISIHPAEDGSRIEASADTLYLGPKNPEDASPMRRLSSSLIHERPFAMAMIKFQNRLEKILAKQLQKSSK